MQKLDIRRCRCGNQPHGPTYYDGYFQIVCPNCRAYIENKDPIDCCVEWNARAMKPRREWIDSNECRPELGEDVLLFDSNTPNQKICIGCLIVKDETRVQLADSGGIMNLNWFSHWMPLPEPPKGE